MSDKLGEAIEQVAKLKISTTENQHVYYTEVLKSIEAKLREVYKANKEKV